MIRPCFCECPRQVSCEAENLLSAHAWYDVQMPHSPGYPGAPGPERCCAAGNLSAAAMGIPVTPQLREPSQILLDGLCLSARSAASHEACRAEGGAGCQAGEVCMQPVLAKDEYLYKVRTCRQFPHTPVHNECHMHLQHPSDSACGSLRNIRQRRSVRLCWAMLLRLG